MSNYLVQFVSHLSSSTHVLNHVRTAIYNKLRCISSVRGLLTTEATATLVSAFIRSRLDYCNSLLSGCPRSLIFRIQKVQNNAAGLIFRICKRHFPSPCFSSLAGYWLLYQVQLCIHFLQLSVYKLSTLHIRPSYHLHHYNNNKKRFT